jgi:hypothetical protein
MGDSGMSTPISVHRCRFVDFQPAAVTALSFAPLPLPAPSAKGKEKASAPRWTQRYQFGTLVIGRANGNIELCGWTGDPTGKQVEASQGWVVQKVCRMVHSIGLCQIMERDHFLLDDFRVLSIQSGLSCAGITISRASKA